MLVIVLRLRLCSALPFAFRIRIIISWTRICMPRSEDISRCLAVSFKRLVRLWRLVAYEFLFWCFALLLRLGSLFPARFVYTPQHGQCSLCFNFSSSFSEHIYIRQRVTHRFHLCSTIQYPGPGRLATVGKGKREVGTWNMGEMG